MHLPVILFCFVIALFPLSHGDNSSLSKLFTIMGQRLNLAPSVAAFKLKNCKPIEDAAREKDILVNKTAQANFTQDELQTYFKGQMEANKMVQYEVVVAARGSLTSTTKLEDIRSQIDALDKDAIPLIRTALEELKSLGNSSSCLDVVNQNVPENGSAVMKTAMYRAATLFIETCLRDPVCKPAIA